MQKWEIHRMYANAPTEEELYLTSEPKTRFLNDMKDDAYYGSPEAVLRMFRVYMKSSVKAEADYVYLEKCLAAANHRAVIRKKADALSRAFLEELDGRIDIRPASIPIEHFFPEFIPNEPLSDLREGLNLFMFCSDEKLLEQLNMLRQMADGFKNEMPAEAIQLYADQIKAMNNYYPESNESPENIARKNWNAFPDNTQDVLQKYISEIEEMITYLEQSDVEMPPQDRISKNSPNSSLMIY